MSMSLRLRIPLIALLASFASCYTQYSAISKAPDCGNRRVGVLVLDDSDHHLTIHGTQIYSSLMSSGFHPVLLNEIASKAFLDEMKSTSLAVTYSDRLIEDANEANVNLDRVVETFVGQMSSPGLMTESVVEIRRIASELKLDIILLITNTSISNLDFDATAILFRSSSFDVIAAWTMHRYGHTAGLAIGAVFTWGLAGFGFIGVEDRTTEILLEKIRDNLGSFRCSR